MAQRCSQADIKRLAQRWREHQSSLTGQPCPQPPPHLQAIADRCDASLLLSLKPELALAAAQPQVEVLHAI